MEILARQEDEAFNKKLFELGFESYNPIQNSGSMVLMLIALAVLMVISLVAKIISMVL